MFHFLTWKFKQNNYLTLKCWTCHGIIIFWIQLFGLTIITHQSKVNILLWGAFYKHYILSKFTIPNTLIDQTHKYKLFIQNILYWWEIGCSGCTKLGFMGVRPWCKVELGVQSLSCNPIFFKFWGTFIVGTWCDHTFMIDTLMGAITCCECDSYVIPHMWHLMWH